MLTTMFYYNHYKPYIFKTKDAKSSNAVNQKNAYRAASSADNRPSSKSDSSAKKLLLNKALNQDVVQYAHNVSHNLIALKDSAKYINYDIEDFDYNTQKYGYSNARNTLREDLNNFVSSFNNSYKFYSSQVHSQSLVDFSVRADNLISSNGHNLGELGIVTDESNGLVFSAEKFDSLTTEELQKTLEDAASAFQNMYSESSSMLAVPLSEHMNFKSLNYYYNYKYGGVTADTFKVIESGMIVDITA